MLSSVTLSGRLAEPVPGQKLTRYVELDKVEVTPNGAGRFKTARIPVHCPFGNGVFSSAPSGVRIILKGRLDYSEQIGVYVVDEIDEIFALKKDMMASTPDPINEFFA